MRNTFKVYERLKREQHIDTLFRSGKAYSVFPLRIVYLVLPRGDIKESPVMTGFSVPKKKFKRSVDRHRVRRLMVEAWRLNKQQLYEVISPDIQIHMFVLFTDNKLPDYETVHKAMLAGISKMKGMAPFSPVINDQPPAKDAPGN